jgi:hypothetical protein
MLYNTILESTYGQTDKILSFLLGWVRVEYIQKCTKIHISSHFISYLHNNINQSLRSLYYIKLSRRRQNEHLLHTWLNYKLNSKTTSNENARFSLRNTVDLH